MTAPQPTDERRFVIWSWEHLSWWKPNRQGYTTELAEAGHYSFADAADITVGHIPAGEEVAMWLEEAQQRGKPQVHAEAGG